MQLYEQTQNKGQDGEGYQEIRKGQSCNRRSPIVWKQQGMYFTQEKNWESACTSFTISYNLDKERFDSAFELGVSQLFTRNYKRYIELRKDLCMKYTTLQNCQQYAMGLHLNKQYDESIQVLNIAIKNFSTKLKPQQISEIYLHIIRLYIENNEYKLGYQYLCDIYTKIYDKVELLQYESFLRWKCGEDIEIINNLILKQLDINSDSLEYNEYIQNVNGIKLYERDNDIPLPQQQCTPSYITNTIYICNKLWKDDTIEDNNEQYIKAKTQYVDKQLQKYPESTVILKISLDILHPNEELFEILLQKYILYRQLSNFNGLIYEFLSWRYDVRWDILWSLLSWLCEIIKTELSILSTPPSPIISDIPEGEEKVNYTTNDIKKITTIGDNNVLLIALNKVYNIQYKFNNTIQKYTIVNNIKQYELYKKEVYNSNKVSKLHISLYLLQLEYQSSEGYANESQIQQNKYIKEYNSISKENKYIKCYEIELYKYIGQRYKAHNKSNEQRLNDLRDRYSNTICAKYALLAGRIKESYWTTSQFLEDDDQNIYNNDQVLWYHLHKARMYFKEKRYICSQRRYEYIFMHFRSFIDSGSYYQNWALHKLSIQPYINLQRTLSLQILDSYYCSAICGSIECIIRLQESKGQWQRYNYIDLNSIPENEQSLNDWQDILNKYLCNGKEILPLLFTKNDINNINKQNNKLEIYINEKKIKINNEMKLELELLEGPKKLSKTLNGTRKQKSKQQQQQPKGKHDTIINNKDDILGYNWYNNIECKHKYLDKNIKNILKNEYVCDLSILHPSTIQSICEYYKLQKQWENIIIYQNIFITSYNRYINIDDCKYQLNDKKQQQNRYWQYDIPKGVIYKLLPKILNIEQSIQYQSLQIYNIEVLNTEQINWLNKQDILYKDTIYIIQYIINNSDISIEIQLNKLNDYGTIFIALSGSIKQLREYYMWDITYNGIDKCSIQQDNILNILKIVSCIEDLPQNTLRPGLRGIYNGQIEWIQDINIDTKDNFYIKVLDIKKYIHENILLDEEDFFEDDEQAELSQITSIKLPLPEVEAANPHRN